MIDDVTAGWEVDEARVRARLSAPDAEPKGQVLGLSGMQVVEAIFAGDLPPAPIGETLDFVPIAAVGCAVHRTLPAGKGFATLELKVNWCVP